LADTPWTHEDWDSNPVGSTTRLTELTAHIAEVRLSFQRAVFGTYTVQGKAHTLDADALQRYLADLQKRLDTEQVIPGATSPAVSSTWTRGKAYRP
jgi:hypothetical protein